MGDLSKHFSRAEVACKCGCKLDSMDYETVNVLEATREHFGVPIAITSGCRCPDYNAKVGGAKNSFHTKCRAVDITVAGVSPDAVQAYLKFTYPGKYGIGCYPTFTHLDTGPVRRWNG